MSDISALESRIAAALDQIRAGIDGMAQAADTKDLQNQLDEERMANAQLQERVRTLKDRHDGAISERDVAVAALQKQMETLETLDAEMQKLRQSNADMRDLNAQMRVALADGSFAPELINRAMMAEIDALQILRSSEAAEVDAILTQLKPMIKEA